jgi:hypothetical protein
VSPDDPRHGTNGGYLQHVFDKESACTPCRDAHNEARRNLWRKRYVRGVDRLYIDATGTIRRIRALMALGWRYSDIDVRAGHAASRATWAHNLVTQERVHIDTAEQVARIYDELSMKPGPSVRLRNLALKRGWAPPLAWDDIDNDVAPNLGGIDDEIDAVVVERLVAGRRIPSTHAEKLEAMRRWLAAGGSERSFCILHGWKTGRYVSHEEGAA